MKSALVRRSIRALFQHLATVRFQRGFELLLRIALRGMNVGGGAGVTKSGEIAVLQRIASRRSDSQPLVLDVGAHKGDYTRAVLSVLGRETRIIAFEPSREAREILLQNVGDSPSVNVLPCALGEREEEVPLYKAETISSLASIYHRRLDHFGVQLDVIESVPVRTLDSVCDELGIGTIDLLKLDIEGHELAVLRGAQRMLAEKRIRAIQFEFGGCNIDSRTFLQDFYYLLKDDFRIYRVVQDGLWPLSEYKEFYELFMTTNIFAEHRQQGTSDSSL